MQKNTNGYSSAVKQAEKVIGYPTSFMNLRWIINDEIANIASHIRKLIATKHPILKNARQLLFTSNVPSWGLIVLLVSKMVGIKLVSDKEIQESKSGILHSQRVLAEVVEMLRTSNIIHKGIMSNRKEMNEGILFGNKMSVLGGDYLLAKSFKEIALLRNSFIQELMSSGVRDMSEYQFLGVRDENNNPLPNRPKLVQEEITIPNCYSPIPIDTLPIMGHMKSEWTLRTILDGGHLLARACQGTLHLSNQSESIEERGYQIGRSFSLLAQAHLDTISLFNDKFSLVSAPIMLHLEDYPELYDEIEKGTTNVNDVDYDAIKKVVLNGNTLDKISHIKAHHYEDCVRIIKEFPPSDARRALIELMSVVNNFRYE